PMDHYIELIFGFGMARVGEIDAARELLARAKPLADQGPVHQFLYQAYDYRIRQALEGKPHKGPLPLEMMEYLEKGMDRMQRYVVAGRRQHARILEPDTKTDPYRHWGARISDLDQALAELTDMMDKGAVIARVQKLLKEQPKGQRGNAPRAKILKASLKQ